MRNMANTIQAVINTLEQLDIKSTYENTNKLLGCFQALGGVRDDLNRIADIQEEKLRKDAADQAVIKEVEKVEEDTDGAAADSE